MFFPKSKQDWACSSNNIGISNFPVNGRLPVLSESGERCSGIVCYWHMFQLIKCNPIWGKRMPTWLAQFQLCSLERETCGSQPPKICTSMHCGSCGTVERVRVETGPFVQLLSRGGLHCSYMVDRKRVFNFMVKEQQDFQAESSLQTCRYNVMLCMWSNLKRLLKVTLAN